MMPVCGSLAAGSFIRNLFERISPSSTFSLIPVWKCTNIYSFSGNGTVFSQRKKQKDEILLDDVRTYIDTEIMKGRLVEPLYKYLVEGLDCGSHGHSKVRGTFLIYTHHTE